MTIQQGGYARYSDYTYTCDVSECVIVDQEVTRGTVRREPTGGGTNRAPRASGSIPAQTLAVSDGAVSVNVARYFTDPDGDALTYTVRSSRNSIVTAAVSGSTVRLTPVGAGTAMVTVTARDPGGLSAMQSIAVTVGGTNRAPRASGSIPAQTLAVSDGAASVNVARYFTDPDGDALTYTVRSSRNSIVTAAVSGSTVRLTPVGAGTAMVTVTARDPGGLSAMQSIAVTVGGTNRAPRASGSIPAQTLAVSDGAASVNVARYFTDPDGDALTYTVRSSRNSIVTAAVSGSTVRLTPVGAGTAMVTVTARDPGGLSAMQSIAVTVGGTNRAPRASGSIPAQTLAVSDGAASVNVARYFTDPDGDALTYTVRSSRNSIVTAAVSGSTVRLTPVGAGTAMVTVTARDPGGLSAMQSIAVTVTAPGVTGFTDDPLVPGMTRVRAVHFRELRTWIDAVRAQAGLRAFAWTDRTLTSRVTPIRRVHLTELRIALDAAYTAAGQRAPTYTDARVTAGTTPIRRRHITELRSAVLALDNCTEALGPVARTVTRSLSWTESCPSVHYSNGRYARYYSFTLRVGARVTIDLTSSSVDTYLALRNGSGTGMGLIESDDDGGSGLNARITRSLSRGTYTIEATTLRGRVTGPFTLKLAVDSSGGLAAETEITHCSGRYIATGLASVSMGGIIRARRSVANVVVTGTANGRHVGIRSLGSIAAGGSMNFSMSSVISTTGTGLRCVASTRWREVAGANAETESGGVTGVATIEGELR